MAKCPLCLSVVFISRENHLGNIIKYVSVLRMKNVTMIFFEQIQHRGAGRGVQPVHGRFHRVRQGPEQRRGKD